MKISVIVPVYNEAALLTNKIEYFRQLAEYAELIFVDGNSADKTVEILQQHHFTVLKSTLTSRGAQLSLGAKRAKHDILLFHHFDSVLPNKALELIDDSLRFKNWGRFNIKINDPARIFRIIETMMNWRSEITSIATGDQAIFAKRDIYKKNVTQLETLPIMEDIYLSKQLKKSGKPIAIKDAVLTSSRYWRKNGILKSIIMMWMFRLLNYFGASPKMIYKYYYRQ
jgi:rSAM/selenodomain-associated transferase 2